MSGIARWNLTPREFQPTPSDYRPALDGVRGIAILAVFLYHCFRLPSDSLLNSVIRKVSVAGWVGVDLFFVLSGFLITGILLDSKGQPGFLRSFFARRALRIFPLYFLGLGATFYLLPRLAEFWSPARPAADQIASLRPDQFWYWTYLQNWRVAFQGHWPESNALNHLWSLAVEEQFYLVWPFVVGGLSSRWLTRVCWGGVGGALAMRLGLWYWEEPSVVMYVTTLTRMDSLCLGALLSMGLRSPVWYPRLTRWAAPTMGALGVMIVGVDVVWPLLTFESAGAHTLGHTLFSLLFGSFIVCAATAQPDHWFARCLSQRCLTLPGQLSYAMYVIHRAVHQLVLQADWSRLPEGRQPLAISATTLMATLALAGLSWVLIEKPFLSLKAYFPRPRDGVRSESSSYAQAQHVSDQQHITCPLK